MKRFALVLIMVFVSTLAFAGVAPKNVLWFWNNRTDADVQYFRYRTDTDPEWHVAKKEVFSVQFYCEDSDPHWFEIQQSYDGENWSESVRKDYQNIAEDPVASDEYVINKSTLAFGLSPFQTFISLSPYAGEEFYSIYSFGAEVDAVQYFGKVFGLGLKGQGTIGYKDTSFSQMAIAANAYVEAAFRLIARRNFDLAVKVGVGTEAEIHKSAIYFTPSANLQVDAGIALNDGMCLMIAPSVSVSQNIFNPDEDYTSYIIRAITVGVEFRK